MIPFQDHIQVYFSDWILNEPRYARAGKGIFKALKENNIEPQLLKSTRDIWVKDFMPVQIGENNFQGFRYEPGYHKPKDFEYRTNPAETCGENNIKASFSNINLDGGNIVGWYNKAIITERVVADNPSWDKLKLQAELERLLQVEVIFIPDPIEDYTGHADGILRWVNNDTLLCWDFDYLNDDWSKKTKQTIQEKGFRIISMPSYEGKSSSKSAIGCYVNYLHLKDLILFPIFETKGNKDLQALELIHNTFHKKIVPININEIAQDGGLLNCCSWSR
jgi:agmatine deiminase